MKYEAVLFDLDGTLIDTVDDIGDAANRVLSNRGFPMHPISTYYQFIGEGVKVLFTRALPQEKRVCPRSRQYATNSDTLLRVKSSGIPCWRH